MLRMLNAQGITPTPGLNLSQLQALTDLVVCATPTRTEPQASDQPAAPGRKHSKKTNHAAPQVKRKVVAASSVSPAESNILTSTLQALANSMQAIEARLQSLENAQAWPPSASLRLPAPVPAPAHLPSTSSTSQDFPLPSCVLLL